MNVNAPTETSPSAWMPSWCEPAAVEEPALTGRELVGKAGHGQEAQRQRPPDTRHAVRSDRADRVVDANTLHGERPDDDDDAGHEADHDRRPGRDERA